jgi:hypothetical protein
MADYKANLTVTGTWVNAVVSQPTLAGVAAFVRNNGNPSNDQLQIQPSSSASTPGSNTGIQIGRSETYQGTSANIWLRSTGGPLDVAVGLAD